MTPYKAGDPTRTDRLRDTMTGVVADASNRLAFEADRTDGFRTIQRALRHGWHNETTGGPCFPDKSAGMITQQDRPIVGPNVVMPDEVIGWTNMVLLRRNAELGAGLTYASVGQAVIKSFGWNPVAIGPEDHTLASLPTLMAHAFGAGLDKLPDDPQKIIRNESGEKPAPFAWEILPSFGKALPGKQGEKAAVAISAVFVNWWIFTNAIPGYSDRDEYYEAANTLLGALP